MESMLYMREGSFDPLFIPNCGASDLLSSLNVKSPICPGLGGGGGGEVLGRTYH